MTLPTSPQFLLSSDNSYKTPQSLRFRANNSNYLTRNHVDSNKKTWTWSAWIKVGTLGVNYRALIRYASSHISIGGVGWSDSIWLNYQAVWSAHPSAALRDTSAWYHVMFIYDTTQAVDVNRFKVYINGVQQSVTVDGGSWPTQNADGFINQSGQHFIGSGVASTYFDGYITEINFIDGVSLGPSYFGKTDIVSGSWIPIKPSLPVNSKNYTIATSMWSQSGLTSFSASLVNNNNYGETAFHTDSAGVGSYLQVDLGYGNERDFNKISWWAQAGTSPSGKYSIQYSDDGSSWLNAYSTYFSVNSATTTAPASTSWTSVGAHRYWRLYKVDAAVGGAWTSEIQWFETDTTGYGTNGYYLPFLDSSSVSPLMSGLGTNIGTATSNGGLAAAFNGTLLQAYASSAIVPGTSVLNGYVGKDWGAGVTRTVTGFRVVGSTDYGFTSGDTQVIVQLQGSTDNFSSSIVNLYTSGVINNYNSIIVNVPSSLIDTTTAYRYHRIVMTEKNGNSVSHALIFGQIEFYFGGIGRDYSGRGNHWYGSGLSVTSGTTYDIMKDSPTPYDDGSGGVYNRGSYCVLSPLAISVPIGTITEGNLKLLTASGNGGAGFGSIAIPTSGKWYWEVLAGAGGGGNWMIGIAEYKSNVTSFWAVANTVFYYSSGQKYVDGTGSAYGATYTSNDLIGVAVNADAGTITFYKNNVSQGSITHTVSGLFAAFDDGASASGDYFYVNWGQRPFTYTPPSGFKALNTFNLPKPTLPIY